MSGNLNIFGAIHIALCIIAIVDVAQSKASVLSRALWIALILLFPCGGLIIYFLLGRGNR